MPAQAERAGLVKLRPLARSDLGDEFVALLANLTTVGAPSRDALKRQFDALERLGALSRVVVLEDEQTGRLVGAGSLLVEPKFIHACGSVGHIEDVVVAPSHRALGLGNRLVAHLAGAARAAGCYKVILDCADGNAAFYERCGFARKGTAMALYFDEDPPGDGAPAAAPPPRKSEKIEPHLT